MGIGTTNPTSANIDATLDTNTQVLAVGGVTANKYYGDGANLTGGIAGVGIRSDSVSVGFGVTFIDFVGSGVGTVTVDTASGIGTINVTGGGGGGGGVSENDFIVQTTSATGVGSFAVASHRSASIIAQIDQTGTYQVGRYLMIHDGTTATVVEEASVCTGASQIASYTARVNAGNAQLMVNMVGAGIATVTTKIDTDDSLRIE